MKTTKEIHSQLKSLLNDQSKLIELSSSEDNMKIIAFGTHYQVWYTKAIKIVEALAPDRLDEFVSYYRADTKRKILDADNFAIQDYIRGIGPGEDHLGRKPFDSKNAVLLRVINQFQILGALSSRIDSVLSDVTGHLLAELQDLELEAASKLMKISPRASGALAGVVLERHLQQTAKNHKITIRKKNPTLSDLNDPLKQKGIYGVASWRKIQLLSDIRNLCTHQKSEEPTKEQVKELISGVNSIIKSIY